MTSANDLIEYGPLLAAMFDPGSEDFPDLLQSGSSPLETAVLSVLTSRRVFWVTHSLAFGHAFDSGSDVLENAGGQAYRELFGTEQFDTYVEDSGFSRYDATLLAGAAVLDALFNTEARMVAMRGTIPRHRCVMRCPPGDSDCVRRCIAGINREQVDRPGW